MCYDGCAREARSNSAIRDHHRHRGTPDGAARIRRALDRGRQRPRGTAEAQTGAGATAARTAPTRRGGACRSRVKVDDWSSDPAWQARVPTRERWLSTNHLMGIGYWVWLIPLGNRQHQPRHRRRRRHASVQPHQPVRSRDGLAARIRAAVRATSWSRTRTTLEDFLALQHYAHGCARVFSPDRWALVGEAGVFSDPFYSPGSDFIGIGNDCTDRSARFAACAGEDISRARRSRSTRPTCDSTRRSCASTTASTRSWATRRS